MTGNSIYITKYDADRLSDIINGKGLPEGTEPESLENLKNELTRARIVDPADIPPDVITMNSRVCLEDLETGEDEAYTLVFPDQADLEQGRISVLAPVGVGMLGYRIGDIFTWKVPQGECQYRVKEITYQPEAAGDYHL